MPPLEDLPAAYLALERERDELKSTNALLTWQIEKLQKQVFGPGKSEKLDRAQLLFQLKELEALAEKASRPALAVSYERRAPAPESVLRPRSCLRNCRSRRSWSSSPRR
jgi:transposase